MERLGEESQCHQGGLVERFAEESQCHNASLVSATIQRQFSNNLVPLKLATGLVENKIPTLNLRNIPGN